LVGSPEKTGVDGSIPSLATTFKLMTYKRIRSRFPLREDKRKVYRGYRNKGYLPPSMECLCPFPSNLTSGYLVGHAASIRVIREQALIALPSPSSWITTATRRRPLEVRWKGLSLPYRVFSKDQRVSHTAIVENKRLGHALGLVGAQQDLRRAPKVMTNSDKNGYQASALGWKTGGHQFAAYVSKALHYPLSTPIAVVDRTIASLELVGRNDYAELPQ
jgi:hypothetical protein